jgi:hypothetical protein
MNQPADDGYVDSKRKISSIGIFSPDGAFFLSIFVSVLTTTNDDMLVNIPR